jgi:hypothetical protein
VASNVVRGRNGGYRPSNPIQHVKSREAQADSIPRARPVSSIPASKRKVVAMTLLDESHWKRLSPLLDELLDLDDAARTLRLAGLRTLDASLADELAALLDAARRARACRFLDGNALDDDPPPPPSID